MIGYRFSCDAIYAIYSTMKFLLRHARSQTGRVLIAVTTFARIVVYFSERN